MAVKHGNEGVVEVASNAVTEVQSWTYDQEDVAPAEITSMGDTEATPLMSGCIRGKGTISVLLDEADSTGQVALDTAVGSDTGVVLHLYGEGKTGSYEYTGTAKITKDGRNVDKSKPNEMTFEFVGVLTRTAIS